MFGVLLMSGRQVVDVKVFRAVDDARKWRDSCDPEDYHTASIYHALNTDDVREAAKLIRVRDVSRVRLVDQLESVAWVRSRTAKAEAKLADQNRSLVITLLEEVEKAKRAILSALRRSDPNG